MDSKTRLTAACLMERLSKTANQHKAAAIDGLGGVTGGLVGGTIGGTAAAGAMKYLGVENRTAKILGLLAGAGLFGAAGAAVGSEIENNGGVPVNMSGDIINRNTGNVALHNFNQNPITTKAVR